jgi:transcriptional regulator with XRE-family HTH domain
VSAYLLDVEELRRRLDQRRRERGLTWRQIAEQPDVSPSMFSRLADGNRPDADALVSLLVWLDLDTDIAIMIKPKEQQ